MEESILLTIKKLLGLNPDYTPFDTDIIVFINSALMTLQQLGVGPVTGLTITGPDEEWYQLIPEDFMLEGVKNYIYLCVKLVFDPPSTSFVMDAMTKMKDELEWRLREQAEFYPGDGSRLGYWQQVVADEEVAKHPQEDEPETPDEDEETEPVDDGDWT